MGEKRGTEKRDAWLVERRLKPKPHLRRPKRPSKARGKPSLPQLKFLDGAQNE